MPHRWKILATGRILLVVLAVTGTGCDATFSLLAPEHSGSAESEPSEAPQDITPVVPDGPPSKLVQIVEQAQGEADEIAEFLDNGGNRQLRIATLKSHVETGVTAAEKLALHDESSSEQRSWARHTQLVLLYQAAKIAPREFLPLLKDYIRKRQDDDRNLSEIASAALIELEYLSAADPPGPVLPALREFARQHPQSGAGAALFEQHGQQLEGEGKIIEAAECYRAGCQLYGQLPAAADLRKKLVRLEQLQAAELQRTRARADQLAAIDRQLGPGEGCFLIYAHEVKPPTNAILTMYRFDYQVLRGRAAASAYIAGLKTDWQWELVRRFPDTQEGYRQATSLAQQLTKKRSMYKN